MVKLLKTPMRGGIVTITDRELVVGEGWLGTRNVRRFPLQSLMQIELLPALPSESMRHHRRIRFRWDDGQSTEVAGIGPLAAQRIYALLHALYALGGQRTG